MLILHIYENKYFTLILIYYAENYNDSEINDLSIEIFYVYYTYINLLKKNWEILCK